MTHSPTSASAPGIPHARPTLGVIVVAAGRGERLGAGIPKAFVPLNGRSLLEHCVSTVLRVAGGGHLVLVVPDAQAGEALALLADAVPPGSAWEASVTPGGRERHESVRCGLDALPEHTDTVLVHDAARPLASPDLFTRVAEEVRRTGDAVIPALEVADTLKRVDTDGVVRETVDRAPLVSVQTPQGFPRQLLAAAHAQLASVHAARGEGRPAGTEPTDDAEVIQRFGGTVRTLPGEVAAHKLTTPGDRALLEALDAAQAGGPHADVP